MNTTTVYVVSYGAVIAVFSIWRISKLISSQAREKLLSNIRKWTLYTLIVPRQKSTSNVSLLAAFCIFLYAVANVVGSVLGLSTGIQFAQRLGYLFAINAVPLFLGGRTNLISDKVLRLPTCDYSLIHRWIGRHSRMANVEIMLITFISAIGLLSFFIIRRYAYEIFLRTHLLLALALMGTLWLHIGLKRSYPVACLLVASSLWVLQKVLWTGFILYRNLGSGPSCQASIVHYPLGGKDSENAVQLRVTVKRPWKVLPGQFVYITIPHGFGLIQAHPYMIAWVLDNETSLEQTIVLLVRTEQGFSSRLRLCSEATPIVLDGPYGGAQHHRLSQYDKVLFMANGIGITSHLLSIRYLLMAHDDRTARVRRLSLVWFLETKDQYEWAKEFILALYDMDHRQIFTIFIFFPCEVAGSAEEPSKGDEVLRKRLYKLSYPLDTAWIIDQEWSAEAGNMMISVCGTPKFETCVRKALRSSKHNITLLSMDFQPDETPVSQVSTIRYTF